MAGEICAEEVCMSDVLKRIKDSLQKHSESMKMSSRTSVLWVQYIHVLSLEFMSIMSINMIAALPP